MLDKIVEILGNSHFEAYIGGPIAGVVASLIFAGFSKSPQTQHANLSPHILHIQIAAPASTQQVQVQSKSNSLLPAMMIGAVLAFLFVAYLPTIASALYFFIAMITTFSISSSVLAVAFGQFNTPAWWLHTIYPTFSAAGSFYVAAMVERSISTEVVAFAKSLLGDGHLTLAAIFNGIYVFFTQVNAAYIQWLTFQMAAFFMAALVAVTALFQCIHYIALANMRSSNSILWRALVVKTYHFSTIKSALNGAVFLAIAWFLASGRAFAFFRT